MFYNNVVFVLGVSCWLCSVGNAGVIGPKQTFSSHVHGEEQSSQVDCSRFKNDLDVLRHFPFSVSILPEKTIDLHNTVARFNKNATTIGQIYIRNETIVPIHVFCLSNLSSLNIEATPFLNNLIPEAIRNLKTLRTLRVEGSPLKKFPEQLTSMTNIAWIQLSNCSLTSVPDLTNLQQLWVVEVDNNQISHVGALPALRLLYMDNNLLTEIPVLENPDRLSGLSLSHNRLKNAQPLVLYKNLEVIALANATLTSIPAEIDQLLKLEHLDISDNQLTSLPTSILNLPLLQSLNISSNLLSPDDIESIREALATSLPDLELYV